MIRQRPSAPRFSHFLAVRLPQVVPDVERLQRLIAGDSSELNLCCVPPEKSHLTLFVFNAGEQQAVEALAACAPYAAAIVGGRTPRLRIRGLGSFSTKVVYAHVGEDDGLAQLATLRLAMMEEFRQRGIRLEAARPGRDAWSAHLTLLKGSNAKPDVCGTAPVLPRSCWASIPAEHTDLGEHPAAAVDLCPFGRATVADGFYPILGSLPLGAGHDQPTTLTHRYP